VGGALPDASPGRARPVDRLARRTGVSRRSLASRRRDPRCWTASRHPATGALYGHLHERKTWREIRELLRSLRARFSEHLIVVLDNFSPHHKTELGAWVAEHDIELVFTPTYSSWLNLIECQFQALRSFALKGSDYPSHADQDAAIRAYLRWHNRNARPAKAWRLNAEVHHSLPDIAA
jgi:transposase